MTRPQLLPKYLVTGYHNWKDNTYVEKADLHRNLADEGQHPRAMVISCSDSRVHATTIFGVDQGEFFMHRNVANLVPPYAPDGTPHCTAAALEYAVTALKVAHVIVIGHSMCGGVRGCHDMCMGLAPQLDEKTSLVGRWVDLLRPSFERVKGIPNEAERVDQMEREGVMVSVENLMTYPFVNAAVTSGNLTLHALWTDIREGIVEQFDEQKGKFVAV